MRKGDAIRAMVLALAVVLALTGNWSLLFFGAVLYQVGRVAAMVLERQARGRPVLLPDDAI